MAIYFVSVDSEHQNKGIFSNFLKEVIAKHPEIRKIIVVGVGSYKMMWCLEKFVFDEIKFCCHGGDYIWARDKNICQCHSYEELVVKERPREEIAEMKRVLNI